ncbi:MAG: hypothetical protein ACI9GC_001372, partial [Phycisphaerales bacterium]
MFTDLTSISIIVSTTAIAVVAFFIAMQWKKQGAEAVAALHIAKLDAEEAKSNLESAKIHGCIDRSRRRQVEAVFDVLRDSVLIV